MKKGHPSLQSTTYEVTNFKSDVIDPVSMDEHLTIPVKDEKLTVIANNVPRVPISESNNLHAISLSEMPVSSFLDSAEKEYLETCSIMTSNSELDNDHLPGSEVCSQ